MKIELDKQAQQKVQKRIMEREAEGLWDKQQKEHLKLLDKKEADKKAEITRKIMKEKENRDAQLKRNEERKKKEAVDNLNEEVKMVKRL